jgi:hypothetical protein
VENAAEVGLIFETHLARDRADRFGGAQKQLLGLKHAITIEIIPWRDGQLTVKDAAEIILANADSFGDFPA